jgi:membrane associated rhomboid family serine protease
MRWVSSLGASGVVMGALGLLTAQSLALLRIGFPPRQLLWRGLFGGLLLLILLGLDPSMNTDVIAHVAGFATGVLLGGMLALLPPALARHARLNHAAELLCGALMVVTWWLALR